MSGVFCVVPMMRRLLQERLVFVEVRSSAVSFLLNKRRYSAIPIIFAELHRQTHPFSFFIIIISPIYKQTLVTIYN
jgi:hypothetical protein